MFERQELPPQWLEQDHFDLRVSWLSREPREGALEAQEEMRRTLREEGKGEKAEGFSLEIAGHPGWWMLFNVENSFHTSLEEALAAAKHVLKRSDLNAGSFNVDVRPGAKAPAQLSKSQRRKLIDQTMHSRSQELPESIVRDAFFEAGDYALHLWIEHVPYREEFSAEFAAPENPLRSLVGKACLVKGLGDEDVSTDPETDDWQELARGTLSLEENTLRVGDWSQAFDPEEEVYGVAFEWAELEGPGMSLYVETVEEA